MLYLLHIPLVCILLHGCSCWLSKPDYNSPTISWTHFRLRILARLLSAKFLHREIRLVYVCLIPLASTPQLVMLLTGISQLRVWLKLIRLWLTISCSVSAWPANFLYLTNSITTYLSSKPCLDCSLLRNLRSIGQKCEVHNLKKVKIMHYTAFEACLLKRDQHAYFDRLPSLLFREKGGAYGSGAKQGDSVFSFFSYR